MITQAQLIQIGEFVSGQADISDVLVTQLRAQNPDIHFTYCMDDDVLAANPVYQNEAFNLYLIDSSDHCLCFTQDMQLASGIVLAEIEPE